MWKRYFVDNFCDVKIINLIEHLIDLLSQAGLIMGEIFKYITTEHAFANKIFS